MSEGAAKYSIANDYDPDREAISADSDPVAEYLTYRSHVRAGDVGFSIEDFEAYIKGPTKEKSLGQ